MLVDRGFERDALDYFPTPLADTLDEAASETSARAQRDRVVETFRVAIRLLGVIALSGSPRSETVQGQLPDHLRKLLRQGLTDGEWVGLTRELVRPFAADPKTFAIPELVRTFFVDGRRLNAIVADDGCCDRLLAMRKSDTIAHGVSGTEEMARDVLSARLPDLETLLKALAWLWRCEWVVPVGHGTRPDGGSEYSVLKLIGVTPRRGFRPEPLITDASLALGKVYACVEGREPLDLHPLAQYEEGGTGQREVFLFDEAARHDVVLRAYPSGLRRQDASTLAWLRQRFAQERHGAAPATAPPSRTQWTPETLQGVARAASDDYLDKMQRERIYLPHLYARRRELELHLASFLDRTCTKSGLLIVGSSGIGKTNTLCQIVKEWRDDAARLGSDVVLLLGGSTLPGGQFSLRDVILDRLELGGSFTAFIDSFDLQHRRRGEQFVLLVDGVDKHPQPGELLRQLDDLVARGDALRWLKVVTSIGEVTYTALRKSGFIPAVRAYYTVRVPKGTAEVDTAELSLGPMTEEELAEAYEKYRAEAGTAPTSDFESLTAEVRREIRNPLFLKIVMEVFNGRRIPRRTLTAEVLLEYANRKIFADPRRTYFVNRLVDLLYERKWRVARLEALTEVAELRDSVLDFSPQSAFVQLLDEQVLEEQVKRVSAILPAQRTVAFAYDRVLEYLLLNLVVNRYGDDVDVAARLSEEAAAYLPLRGVLTTLLVAKAYEGAVDEVGQALRRGNAEVMTQVGVDVFMELDQTVTGDAGSAGDPDRRPAGDRLIEAMLRVGTERDVEVLIETGARLEDQGQYRRARALYEAATRASALATNRALAVRAFQGLGRVKDVLGAKRDALQDYDKALGLARSIGDRAAEEALLDAIGYAQLQLGDLRTARRCFEASLAVDEDCLAAEVVGAHGGLAQTLSNLAFVSQLEGDLDKALSLSEQARQACAAAQDMRGLARSLNEKAMLARRRGYLEESERCLEEAIRLHRESGDRRLLAQALRHLGAVFMMEGRFDEALEHYGQSLKIYTDIGDKAGLASTENTIGEAHRWASRFDFATAAYSRALRLYEEMGSSSGVEMCLLNLGATHLFAGEPDEAIALLERAQAMEAEQLGNEVGEPECLAYLSAAAWARGEPERALAYSDAAVRVTSTRRFSEEDVQLVNFYRYRILLGLGRREEAVEALRTAYNDVMRQASELQDGPVRERFIQAFPMHRWVVEAWTAEQGAA